MCGVCGVVQVDGEPREVIESWRLDAMTDAMTHRGPDDRGTFSQPGVAFGVRRLSIVDVQGGHQPFISEDGRTVGMQNGELYNHGEIRRKLADAGHRFTSRCDTEILPHLYEEHGDRFVERLHGKFGLAVWDGWRGRAVIARDRLGVKPIYWARRDDLVVFASEMKALLASGIVDVELDPIAVDLYLTFGYVPGPRTILKGVSKLRPGGVLIVDRGVEERTYWRYPAPAPDEQDRGIEVYAGELTELLSQSVKDRLMSDVPLGAMLSGGLDSSVVVALMAREMTEPVHTFAVGFLDDAGNELEDARKVAAALDCNHHELALTLAGSVALEDLVWHLDEPIADLSAVGFEGLCRLASEHVTVALSGQGADELFGGYRKHRVAATVRDLVRFPSVLRRSLAAAPLPRGSIRRAVRSLAETDDARRLLEMSARIDSELRGSLLRDVAVDGDHAYAVIDEARNGVSGDPLSMTLFLDAKLGLVDHMLLYFDKASMAHSLEVRVPFLDHRLVEWAAKVPSRYKASPNRTKRVLRSAADGLVPSTVLAKRKQGFFRESSTAWLQAQLNGEPGERLLSADARYRDVIEADEVERVLASFRRRPTEDTARLVFAVLVLEAWLVRFGTKYESLRPAAR